MDDRPPPSDSGTSRETAPSQWNAGATHQQQQQPTMLRQRGIGEIIDAAIQLYRSKWRDLLAIVSLVVIPLSFVEGYFLQSAFTSSFAGSGQLSQAQVNAFIATGIVALFELLFVQPFLVAAVAKAATDVYLGKPVMVGQTYRFALTKVLSILWISILIFLMLMLGFVLLVIPAFLVWVRTSFATVALVVEGKRGPGAIGRSWRLARGHFWRLFGALIVAGLVAAILSSVLTVPSQLIATAIGPSGWAVEILGSALATVVVTPFTTLITVLLYFDLRIRKEGYDLEVMAQELALST